MSINRIWGAIQIEGVTAGALEAINSGLLESGDVAIVRDETLDAVYFYRYDSGSSVAASVPKIIKPDNVTGDGRWFLISPSYFMENLYVEPGKNIVVNEVIGNGSGLTLGYEAASGINIVIGSADIQVSGSTVFNDIPRVDDEAVQVPVQPYDLTTKDYVDGIFSGGIDHSTLTNLTTGDDHTQYILVDGTRAFSGVVVGVYPTISNHLATKLYVDTEIGNYSFDHTSLTISGTDDDHSAEYVHLDGRRWFTLTSEFPSVANVGGVPSQSPTKAYHLTTKDYVDATVNTVLVYSDDDVPNYLADSFVQNNYDLDSAGTVINDGANTGILLNKTTALVGFVYQTVIRDGGDDFFVVDPQEGAGLIVDVDSAGASSVGAITDNTNGTLSDGNYHNSAQGYPSSTDSVNGAGATFYVDVSGGGTVVNLTPLKLGTGYVPGDTIVVDESLDFSTLATGTIDTTVATVTSSMSDVTVVEQGTNYIAGQLLDVTGDQSAAASGVVLIETVGLIGNVETISVDTAGTGYQDDDDNSTVAFATSYPQTISSLFDDTGTGSVSLTESSLDMTHTNNTTDPELRVSVVLGDISHMFIDNAGVSGTYVIGDEITFTGDGTGATWEVSAAAAGQITGIQRKTAASTPYTYATVLDIDSISGSGAELTPHITGPVSDFYIADAGSGLTEGTYLVDVLLTDITNNGEGDYTTADIDLLNPIESKIGVSINLTDTSTATEYKLVVTDGVLYLEEL